MGPRDPHAGPDLPPPRATNPASPETTGPDASPGAAAPDPASPGVAGRDPISSGAAGPLQRAATPAVVTALLAFGVTAALSQEPTAPPGQAPFNHLVVVAAAVLCAWLAWWLAGRTSGATGMAAPLPPARPPAGATGPPPSPDRRAPAAGATGPPSSPDRQALAAGATRGPTSRMPLPRHLDRQAVLLAAGLAVACLLLYFPPFLARYGPYAEDNYFLTVLHRMQFGQEPFTHFEFQYGPLLAHPVAAWVDLFGFSMTSYYSFLAIVEAAQYALLALLVGAFVPDLRSRLLGIFVLGILLFNDNLGLSWWGMRRFLPVLVLLLYAMSRRWQVRALAAVLAGVSLAMSPEYGISCLVAIGALATVEAVAERRPRPLVGGAATCAAALVAAVVVCLPFMGSGVVDWVMATARVVASRAGGEAGFPFQWSVNAMAVLWVLFLASWRLGGGARRLGPGRLTAGDALLVASVAYALVAFKSGFARSDMYHLAPPLLGLVLGTVLQLPASVFRPSGGLRRAATWALVLVVVTYTMGLIGPVRFWLKGLAFGAVETVRGAPTGIGAPSRTRGPWIGWEEQFVEPSYARTAEFLASDDLEARPVVFYGRTWGLDKMVGVPKPRGVYPTDDYLMSDLAGESIRRYLEEHPEALVLARVDDWGYLMGTAPEPDYGNHFWIMRQRTWLMRFLERWSSSHFGIAVLEEHQRMRARWIRTVGTYVREHYRPIGDFDRLVVLERGGTEP